MRIAALYDVHGNLPALEAVLDDVQRSGVDRILVGGDVLPGPMPVATLDRLLALDLPVDFLRGNGEREVLAVRDGTVPDHLPGSVVEVLRWVAGELPADRVAALCTWPETVRLNVEGAGDVLFCHATPRSDSEIFTRRTPEAALSPIFAAPGVRLVVCGHTHMQFDRSIGGVRVVNAGSVGVPFGEPGAFWLLLGPAVELRRTSYDLAAAADRVRATEYPQAERFADHDLQRPLAEADALEALEAAALA